MGNSFATTPSSSPAAGHYAVQSDIENVFGTYNVAMWSNRDDKLAPNSDGSPQPDINQIQQALNRTDAFINWMGSQFKYGTPLPTTITQWARLNYLAAEDAGVELYLARGVIDENKDEAGKFAARRRQLRGYTNAGGKWIPGEIEEFFIAGVGGATRVSGVNVTRSPEVVLSPVAVPYGTSTPNIFQSNQIPTIP